MTTNAMEHDTHGLIIKRIAAFIIDYSVIILPYIVGVTLFNAMRSGTDVSQFVPTNPAQGQLMGFLSVTLPVTLYFVVMESWRGATLGKLRMNLVVQAADGTPASFAAVLLRNVLKFVPWEITHMLIWRNVYSESFPTWAFVGGLALVYGLLGIYIATMVVSPSRQTLYDGIAGVVIVSEDEQPQPA